jgi:hypothetical protein
MLAGGAAMTTTIDEKAPDVAARLQAIRSRLPGQMRAERVKEAELRYGSLYTLADIRRRVAETLALRVGYVRSAVFEPVEAYAEPIPAEALLKYDDAVQSGLFSKFLVATPRYYESRQTDPWLVGEVAGTDRYAVIAYWE